MSFAPAAMKQFGKKVAKMRELQAREYAVAGVSRAADVTPTRGDTKDATGRARESIRSNSNVPRKFDPGKRAVHRKPGAREALFGIKGRSSDDDVVLDMGVSYAIYVERIYHSIDLGAAAAEFALKAKHHTHARIASRKLPAIKVSLR